VAGSESSAKDFPSLIAEAKTLIAGGPEQALTAFKNLRSDSSPDTKLWGRQVDAWVEALKYSDGKNTVIRKLISTSLSEISEWGPNYRKYLTATINIFMRLQWLLRDDLDQELERELGLTVLALFRVGKYYPTEGPGAELLRQPLTSKDGVPLGEISLTEMLDRLTAMGVSAETRERAEAEIRYARKPLWNVPREEQLPDLRGMTAFEHLRKVWADEIERWGNKVYLRSVRLRDPELADTVSKYAATRRRRDLDRGAAKGLTLVKGFEPSEGEAGRPKPKPLRLRKAGLTQ
jgi:hypothetical protein